MERERAARQSTAGDVPPADVLAAMASHLTEAVQLVDRDGQIRYRLGPPLGPHGPGDGAGTSVFDHVHPDDLPKLMELGIAVRASAPGWKGSLPTRLRHVDGSWRACRVDVVNCLDDPLLDGIVVRTREVSQHTAMEMDELAFDDDAIAESLAEAVPVPLIILDPYGRMEFANPAARALCDLPPGPTRGRHLPDLAVDADRVAVAEAVRELLTRLGSRTVVFSTRGWQGRSEVRVIEARLLARGLADRPSTIIVTLDDVTERRREVADLRRRATSDPLTGLLNRTALLDEMRTRLTIGPLTAIYCDLDDFKNVNDTLGHAVGDEILVEVASLLRSMARSSDAIGRLGGDEFVIVCDGLARPHTNNLVARLDEALDVGLGVRVSVGVAASPAGGSAEDLLARADLAMYANKRGLNRRVDDDHPTCP